MDIYDWTCRGPLQATAAHTVVQRFATRHRVEFTRAMPAWASHGCGRMVAEEWANLSTTVQYGRQRPGWPLHHHVLDRPGKLWTLTDVPSLRIEPSSRHGRVLTHRSCCVHAGHGMGRPALLLWTFDCSSLWPLLYMRVRAAIARFATRRANTARERTGALREADAPTSMLSRTCTVSCLRWVGAW